MNQNCGEATEDNVDQKDIEHFVINVISQWQTTTLHLVTHLVSGMCVQYKHSSELEESNGSSRASVR